MNEELQNQLAALVERVNELEQRVETLEKGGSTARPVSNNVGSGGGAIVSAASPELAEAIRTALEQLGEADVAALRQQLVKNGQPATLTRSDINKMLYNRKDVFAIARQEGMKPVWKLLA